MSKGSNSSGLRRYNERVLISELRRLGLASKFELAKLANLTPQAVTRIIDDLEQADLVEQRGKVQRGLGQPSTMYALNPKGAFSIGVNAGRNDIQILLMDFCGNVLSKVAHEFTLPDPDFLIDKVVQGVNYLRSSLSLAHQQRIIGVGLAIPWFMGAWKSELNMSDELALRWNQFKPREELMKKIDLPVFVENDCSAAAVAELKLGCGNKINNFLYIFIGTFVGGGVVLHGELEAGVHGNAGALASMPVTASQLDTVPPVAGSFETLANRVSIYALRRHLNARGFSIDTISQLPLLLPAAQVALDEWIEDAIDAFSFVIFSATGVLDLEAIVLDANLPRDLVHEIVGKLAVRVNLLTPTGVLAPQVLSGSVGPDARAIGGAILPFYANFSPDKNVMLTGD
ncbi:ROK family transcriptional regulator [Cellvibrio sp. OA-2007]|uniref:ROK family transcriptional regulator n=1 Tax=Cellvibrio sp. OA-2007 TaxID=529823 RepID=UPI00078502EA|nr:ROK family transcriptional regulator [Cellvibrio sp. OA-2007]